MTRPVDLVLAAAERLATAGSASPSADARWLLAHAIGMEPARILSLSAVDPGAVADFDVLVERRMAGEPVQHITGEAYFRHETLAVGPGVFIPRPETELLVDHALGILAARPPGGRRVVELCAGSGAITLALAHELGGLELHAVELSDDAWPWLQRNLDGVAAHLLHGDMATAFPALDGSVDVVVANPPYVPEPDRDRLPRDVVGVDPDLALFSGPDGLDALRVVRDVAARLLRPGGWVVAEHDESHGDAVLELFGGPAFDETVDHPDLLGRPRHVIARRAAVAGLAT